MASRTTGIRIHSGLFPSLSLVSAELGYAKAHSRQKAVPLTGNLSLVFCLYHGFASMVRGAGLTVG